MKVSEFELAKAYYCGLCRTLREKYRKTSILNYDCTFIYILAESLGGQTEEAVRCGCGLHPIQKRNAVFTPAATYAADINALMGYAKAKDDADDSGGTARLRLLAMNGLKKRAFAARPGLFEKMTETAGSLRTLEEQNSPDTDATADTYAQLFGEVLTGIDVMQSHVLYDLGYAMGRWVYLIDALDDVERDIKNGDYNVYVAKYGLETRPDVAQAAEIKRSLYMTLGAAAEALGRLNIAKNRSILDNIVKLGLKKQTERILEGTTDEPVRSSGCK